MGESNDFEALKNISNEVDNSQVKIKISSQCMKAQAFLLDKLRKQAERDKELCKFIRSNNLKLETEIKFSEQEIISTNAALETVKLGNIELNKEYMLSKERKAEIFERTKIGKKKYDNLWLMAKKRYETIPIVQKLNESKNKNQTLQANINAFIDESNHLVNEIKIKSNDLKVTDRARIIELAEYFVRERTKMLLTINENTVKIKELSNEVEMLKKEKNKNDVSYDLLVTDHKEPLESDTKDSTLEDNWSNWSKNTENDTLALPKLHLHNNDLDIFSIKLDQLNKVDLQDVTTIKRAASSTILNSDENPHKIQKTEQRDIKNYISPYFDISLDTASNDDRKIHNKNYSEKKLIHILEDIKLDKSETYKIIETLEASQFQATKYIGSKNIHQYEENCNIDDEVKTIPVQKDKSMEVGEIKEIKLSNPPEDDMVDPPSQFLDVSQNGQEKKIVSFNIQNEKEIPTLVEECNSTGIVITKSQEKILNDSITSEEIKDKILKTHNLDLSPEFVYSKSSLMHKQHSHTKDNITSKFFETENGAGSCIDMIENEHNKNIQPEDTVKCDENKYTCETEICTVIQSNVVVSSPKEEIKNFEVPMSGLLFNHGPQGITESLNLSVSTTGFEDSEDFPHCIDSSILLSPKADIPATVPSSYNNEVLSEEVPNFLAGFRKTGISFFGNTTSSDTKPDSGAQSLSGGFNFAFAKEEKKGRGGFFSMFH